MRGQAQVIVGKDTIRRSGYNKSGHKRSGHGRSRSDYGS